MSRHANVATDKVGVKVSHVTHMNEFSLSCAHHLGLGVKVSHAHTHPHTTHTIHTTHTHTCTHTWMIVVLDTFIMLVIGVKLSKADAIMI